MLSSLSAILDKAETYPAERNIDPAVLLGWRLAPDMFALTRQVQIATDHAKGCCARLAAIEVPKYPDDETTFADLRAPIARTIDFVQGFEPSDIDGSEERDITITAGGREMRFKGQQYLVSFVLPDFYFHVTTAYAILRHCGLPIGKRDYGRDVRLALDTVGRFSGVCGVFGLQLAGRAAVMPVPRHLDGCNARRYIR